MLFTGSGSWNTEDSTEDSTEMRFQGPEHWNYPAALVPYSPTFFPTSVAEHSLFPADWTATQHALVTSGHSFNPSSWSGYEDPTKTSVLSFTSVDLIRSLTHAPIATEDLQTHWNGVIQTPSSSVDDWFRAHDTAATEGLKSISVDWSQMKTPSAADHSIELFAADHSIGPFVADHSIGPFAADHSIGLFAANHSINVDWSRAQDNTIANYRSIPGEWSPTATDSSAMVVEQHIPVDGTHSDAVNGDESIPINWNRTPDSRIASCNDWSRANSTDLSGKHQSIQDDWTGPNTADTISSSTDSQQIFPSMEEEEDEAGEQQQQQHDNIYHSSSPLSTSQESFTDEEVKLSSSDIALLAKDYLAGPMTTRDIIATRIHFRRVLQGQKTLTSEDLEKPSSRQLQVSPPPQPSLVLLIESFG